MSGERKVVSARSRSAVLVALLLLTARASAAQERAPGLDTVHVTVTSRTAGTRAASVRSATVIGRAEIDARPARSVAELLASTLGVELESRSPAQADLAIRGSSSSQVLVLVDGVRLGDLQSNHFNLDLAVPLDAIERIEVLRGPGSALYGPDAAGGVVNIVTVAGSGDGAPRHGARAWGGGFGTAGASISAARALGAFGVHVSGEHERSDGHRSGTDYETTQATVAVQHRAGEGRLRAQAGIGERDFGAADFYAAYPSFERTSTRTASLRWDAPAGTVSGHVTAAARRHEDDFILDRENPALYRNRHLTWQSSLEAVARVATSSRTEVAAGAEGSVGRLWSARLGDRREDRVALFAEATRGRPGDVVVNAGTRVDWSSVNGVFASPSLGVAIPAGRWTRLRASAGRGLRAPTWTERYYEDPANLGDPDLRPEEFWAAEIGLLVVPPRRWSLDLAAFTRRATDLIDWAKPADAAPDARWRTMNVASATYHGIEAEVGVRDVLGAAVSLRGSVLAFDAEGADGFTGKYALRPTTRTAGLTVSAPLWTGANVTLDGAWGKRATGEERVQVDARIAQRWRDVRLVLDLRNLTDADWLDAAARPVAGRAAFLGVEWRGGSGPGGS